MIAWLKSYWSKPNPDPKKSKAQLTIHTQEYCPPGTQVEFSINDWTVTWECQSVGDFEFKTNGELLRTLLDPAYKEWWSGDVFAVKVLLRSGEINERNYP